jgi:hypothetical protein
VEVVAAMPSRTTTSPLIMVIKLAQMVRTVRMTRATTLALFQKKPKAMMAINPAEEVVEDVVAVDSSPEGTAITIVVVTMAITKRVVSLTTAEAATATSITMSTEVESRSQLREITNRWKRRKIRLPMAETTSTRIP